MVKTAKFKKFKITEIMGYVTLNIPNMEFIITFPFVNNLMCINGDLT